MFTKGKKRSNMRRMITGGILLLGGIALLTGCGGYQPSGQPPQSLAKSAVQSQSYRLFFFEDSTDSTIIAPDGTELSDFLQELTLDPPGYMRLKPHGGRLAEEDVVRLLEQSGLYGYSAVEVMPAANEPADGGAILELELTYYSYSFRECGAQLDRRLVDHESWITPGFGCAVNHNRLVSLVRPANPPSSGKLAPPLARSEVKAITTFQTLPPRPFPPAEN